MGFAWLAVLQPEMPTSILQLIGHQPARTIDLALAFSKITLKMPAAIDLSVSVTNGPVPRCLNRFPVLQSSRTSFLRQRKATAAPRSACRSRWSTTTSKSYKKYRRRKRRPRRPRRRRTMAILISRAFRSFVWRLEIFQTLEHCHGEDTKMSVRGCKPG